VAPHVLEVRGESNLALFKRRERKGDVKMRKMGLTPYLYYP